MTARTHVLQPSAMSLRDRVLAEVQKGPTYSLDLVDRLDLGWLGHFRIYGVLRSLEDAGAIESYDDWIHADERGGRPRRYYRARPGSGA